jgi:anaerobic selenocysteine-containing dehydrogenase/ferredoxin-NADP reductase
MMVVIEQKDGYCALCKSRCGATYSIEGGRLVAAGPAPHHPTGRSLCVKGKAAPEILYSSDRLMFPLRRTTPKSSDDPAWERISWDEAMSEVARRISDIREAYGPEAVAVSTTTPSGTALSDGEEWVERLIQIFGTPNWVSTTEICNWHKDFAHAFTYGIGIGYPDYLNADTILLWGFNPSSVWLDQATQVAEGRSRGAKLIVVDPRQSGFAIGANLWIRVRPGSDGILMLGVMRLLIESGRYNLEFVRRWTNAALLIRDDTGEFLRQSDISGGSCDDFVVATGDSLQFLSRNGREADHILSNCDLFVTKDVVTKDGVVRCSSAFERLLAATRDYTLEQVAALTWVEAPRIQALADALAEAKSVAYYTWTGLGQHAQATQIDRAFATLMALKGSFDAPGGNLILPSHKRNAVCGPSFLPREQLAKAIGMADKPLGPPKQGRIIAHDFYRAVLDDIPYKVRGMIGFGSNLAVAHADSRRGREALQKLEFYVHCDVFENPSARFADILLPINTPWERDALRIGFGSGVAAQEYIQLRQKMVEPLGESRSDAQFCFDLAPRLGLADKFFGGDIETARKYILEPIGITLDYLRVHPEGVRIPLAMEHCKYSRTDGQRFEGFNTETGLVELYSALLRRHGQPPTPRFDDDQLPGNDEFPFVLTTAKTGYYCHSQHRQIPSLRKREPHPVVELAPDTAENLGLEADEWVELETKTGRVRMKAKINKSLHPRVLKASYGWWQNNSELSLPSYDPFDQSGANYNLLVSADRLDPVSGAAAHRSQSCRLNPLKSDQPKRGWRGYRKMRVAALERVADEVTAVSLIGLNDETLPDYDPGQHVVVRCSTGASEANELVRCYSLTGSAVEPTRKLYKIAVRFVRAPPNRAELSDGRMSGLINRDLKVGDIIETKAPAGSFSIPTASRRPVVLVAGGIGITPFMSYLETMSRQSHRHRIHLVYVNRTSATEAFSERLVTLEQSMPRLTLARFFTGASGVLPEKCRSGRPGVRDVVLPEFEIPPLIYMCGPSSMTESLREALTQEGHPPDLIFEESFSGGLSDPSLLPAGPFKVTFSRSGKMAVWTPCQGSLLELAEREGVRISSGCRAGQCESCEVGLLSGEIQYRAAIQHNAEETFLACQAVPRTDLVINA